jgi:monoamine oxidase
MPECEFENRRAMIEQTKRHMDMEDLEKNIADTEREFARFYSQAATLKEQIGELTPEKRQQLDKEFWAHQAKEQAAIDYMTSGRLSERTIGMIQYLPAQDRTPLLNTVSNHQGITAWYHGLEYTVPELQLTDETQKQLRLIQAESCPTGTDDQIAPE